MYLHEVFPNLSMIKGYKSHFIKYIVMHYETPKFDELCSICLVRYVKFVNNVSEIHFIMNKLCYEKNKLESTSIYFLF